MKLFFLLLTSTGRLTPCPSVFASLALNDHAFHAWLTVNCWLLAVNHSQLSCVSLFYVHEPHLPTVTLTSACASKKNMNNKRPRKLYTFIFALYVALKKKKKRCFQCYVRPSHLSITHPMYSLYKTTSLSEENRCF